MRQPPISGWTVVGGLVGAALGIGIGLLIAQYFINQGTWEEEAIRWGRLMMALFGMAVLGGFGAGLGDRIGRVIDRFRW
ncbi:MAG: hypothetical protein OXI25_03680 [Chloroflexota bacterium]|nr:hypothetical protein [Chloroflexota bacterium]